MKHKKFPRVSAFKFLKISTSADGDFHEREICDSVAAGDSEFVVTVYAWGYVNPELRWIELEACEGGELSALIRKDGVKASEFWRLVPQMVRGVHDIHTKELVHLDLKPPNILLTASGDCRIADFGLARACGNESKTQSQAGGTIFYQAPEVGSVKTDGLLRYSSKVVNFVFDVGFVGGGRKSDSTSEYEARAICSAAPQSYSTTQADIFSLGVILHEMACGTKPNWSIEEPLQALDQVRWCGSASLEMLLRVMFDHYELCLVRSPTLGSSILFVSRFTECPTRDRTPSTSFNASQVPPHLRASPHPRVSLLSARP